MQRRCQRDHYTWVRSVLNRTRTDPAACSLHGSHNSPVGSRTDPTLSCRRYWRFNETSTIATLCLDTVIITTRGRQTVQHDGGCQWSQSSQGSHNSASRRRQSSHNRRSARQFMDRLRLELLLGHRGTETSQARAGQDNDDSDEGARSDDEETPDRAAEPGPSEQPPETGHPNDGSQADDEFTVMDVDEEQPEHEASQPPRKRGRFENERSDSMRESGRGRASSMTRTRSR